MEKLSGKRLFMLTFGIMMSLVVFGQQVRVSGTVSDAADRSTLPGVNVVVKGTLTGTITGLNGEYSLQAQPGDVLVFTFIGYLQQEVAVGNQTVVNVALQTDVQALDEVVVIGYGTVKKSDRTGSVTAVSSKDFNKGAITSAQDLLVGKTAGVVITTPGGAPGSAATIRIRGGSSLNASNDPLIIIDGVPISNNNVSGSSNILSFVNPNDIETFTILKDASATAIYGSRASNGVILITTKKGKAGTPLTVSYDGNVSAANPIAFVDVFSGDEMRQIAYEKAQSGLYDVDDLSLLGSQNTNWQKEIFRTAISSDHNISLAGAVKNFPYRFSVGYTDQNGILKNTDMQRFTGSLNLNPTFFGDALKVNVNLKGMNTHQNFGDSGAIGSAVSMDPTQVVMDGNEASDGYYQWENYGANLGTPNPVEQALAVDNRSVVNRFIGNIQLDYALFFLPELRANLNLGTDYTTGDGHNNRPVTSPQTLTSPLNGRLTDYSGTNRNNLLDFYLNYVKDLNSIDSRIDATAGYSWQHFQREGNNYTRGIIDEQHQQYTKSDSSSYITENYLVSFFGRVNYILKEKYLLTATIREDGSSRFAEDNRWGFFPSVALAWKIKDESFLKDVKSVTDLKLRLGWGITGQQDVGNDYPAQAVYREASMGSYYPIGGQFLPTLRPDAYDPDIKWEETTTLNAGLDFAFVADRITGSVDIYKRTTNDMLNTVTIPSGSNFSNTLLTNVGSMENRGFELSLNVVPVSKSDMTLTIGFNATYNQNEVTKLLITDDPNYIGVTYGGSFTGVRQVTRVGYPVRSFFVNKQVYDDNGNPIEGLYVDLSGEGGVVNGDNADKYIYHSPAPDWLLGLSARFEYKNFDASASARGSIGNYVLYDIASSASYDQLYQIGYFKNFTKALAETNFVKRQFTSDYFVENASFLKLDNISAGYRFDNLFGAVGARLSFTVQNALILTKYSGLDPEVSGGFDNNFYPRPRTYIVGLGLTF
jgi:TonB-linked SusC/RagA family outer membrane protein